MAGILRPDELARHLQLDRRPAGDAVAHWVENHWFLSWDLPAGVCRAGQVLGHPTVSLTAELVDQARPGVPEGKVVVVTGVATRRFDVELRGRGRVAGVRFRPGGLAALTGLSASSWTDRSVPAEAALPEDLCRQLADPGLVATPADWAAAAEQGLAGLDPGGDARYEELLRIVNRMLDDRTLVTVAQVAERHNLATRSLQRLFLRYVGVSPKWVLARYRMHDVVTELDAGYVGTMSDLAHQYGWYDQAHFTRDFVALVGVTPTAYRPHANR